MSKNQENRKDIIWGNVLKRISIAVLVLLAGPANAFAGFVPMKPGKWLITATTKMPGLPYPIPSVSHTLCYSSADVRRNKAIPSAHKGCHMKYDRIRGSSMVWKMVCKDNATITGEMTSTGSTYQANVTSEGAGRKFITNVTGRRVGACK